MTRKKYGIIKLPISCGSLDYSSCSKDQMMVLKERPVIYIYYCPNSYYVGQTDQFLTRHGQHLLETRVDYRQFDKVIVLFGQYVDGNSQNDLERLLITYLTVDNESLPLREKRTCCNETWGNKVSDYPTKAEVRTEVLIPFWKNELQQECLAHELSLDKLRRSILFKYSPFIELSPQQSDIIDEILANKTNYLIEGVAGTGKTVVLTNLAARLCPDDADSPLRIGVVVKSNWVKSARRIFDAYGISRNVAVGSAFHLISTQEHYDVIIVDEAHRLRWNCPKQNHLMSGIFDENDPQKNELFLLGEKSDRLILLYDSLQMIRPSDIPRGDFNRYIRQHVFQKHTLLKQFRVQIHDPGATYTADDYIAGICTFLQLKEGPYDRGVFQNNAPDAYFGIVDSISELFRYVDEQRQYRPTAQCRVVAGYARPWGSKCKPGSKKYTEFDWVEDDRHQWRWNSTYENWIARPGSEDEIGSIHAIQGIDLDYAGVIVANDLTFADGKVTAVKSNYYDVNGTPARKDFSLDELTEYVKQVYYVLLTRGISGIRVYFEDEALRRHFMEKAGLM